MGILSNTVSLTRYHVNGNLEKPIMETVNQALIQNTIKDIDHKPYEKSVGWTSFDKPYAPDFSGSSFVYGSFFMFSLRIDKKSVPSKIVQKETSEAISKRLETGDRAFLSKNEKNELKEAILAGLYQRVPATPHIHDLIWDMENRTISFFSSQKNACEELETLFQQTFNIQLIRLFPYTQAELKADLTPLQKDEMKKIEPTRFV